MFSAALGLAGSVVGAIGSMNAAKNAAKASMYDTQQNRLTQREALDFARTQQGIGLDLLRRENMLMDYTMQQNAANRGYALDQRDYGRRMVDTDRAQLLREREFEIDRMRQMDRAAASEYERRRAQIEANTRITASERERALAELQRAQQIAQQERQFEIDRLAQDRDILAQERGFGIDQYNYVRDIAAREREFDVGQLQRGQQIAGSERSEALRWLTESRDRAQQERQFDVDQLGRAQQQRADERAFNEREYRAYRAQALAERADDLARRNQIDDATNRFAQQLDQALATMGPMQSANLLGADAIAAEAARRELTAVDDINRLTDRVASTNEANLIRAGVDQSTRATQERSDIVARMAGEMAKARDAARSEAVRYVGGVNDQLRLGDELERIRREQTLREIATANGQPIEMLMRNPQVRSALGGPDYSSVGSAVYDRQVQSGNDFRGPLDVGSANYEYRLGSAGDFRSPVDINSTVLNRDFGSANNYRSPLDVGSAVYGAGIGDLGYGLSSITGARTGTGVGPYNVSGEFDWVMPNISSGAAVLGNAGSIMGSVSNSRGNQAYQSQALAQSAAQGAGSAWADLFKNGGALLDSAFGRKTNLTPPNNNWSAYNAGWKF